MLSLPLRWLHNGRDSVSNNQPHKRPVTRNFDVFFDLRLNKRLSKQWWGWWFETLSRPLWRHCDATSFRVMTWCRRARSHYLINVRSSSVKSSSIYLIHRKLSRESVLRYVSYHTIKNTATSSGDNELLRHSKLSRLHTINSTHTTARCHRDNGEYICFQAQRIFKKRCFERCVDEQSSWYQIFMMQPGIISHEL